MRLMVLISLHDEDRILQPGAHLFPHQLVQHIGANPPLRAAFLLEKAAAGAQTTIVVAAANLLLIGLFTCGRRATGSAPPTTNQLAQQITALLEVSWRKCLV